MLVVTRFKGIYKRVILFEIMMEICVFLSILLFYYFDGIYFQRFFLLGYFLYLHISSWYIFVLYPHTCSYMPSFATCTHTLYLHAQSKKDENSVKSLKC